MTCDCGKQMKLRINRSSGRSFWGCTAYPKCKHTKSTENSDSLKKSDRGTVDFDYDSLDDWISPYDHGDQ